MPSTYYVLQISEESLSPSKHLTALLSRSFLSCPPATKLSHFARYGFEGSRPGRSIIAAVELLRRLNTPNQPTFENGHVTTFRNCHYKAWHSHRLTKTSLAGKGNIVLHQSMKTASNLTKIHRPWLFPIRHVHCRWVRSDPHSIARCTNNGSQG